MEEQADPPDASPEPHESHRRRAWPGAGSTPTGPSGPSDYALINAAFAGGLLAVVALARAQARRGIDPPPLRELPLLSMATFALSHVLAKEKVATWLREPFVQEGADHRPMGPEGDGLRFAVGELLTCTRCVGAWSALGLVALRVASPPAGRTVGTVLAAAGANNVLQAGFRLLVDRANRAAPGGGTAG